MIRTVIAWAVTMRIVDWFSLVASVCSIIALPIAIWQIVSMKKQVEATEQGIREILTSRIHEKLEALLAVVKAQHNELIKLQSLVPQKGASKRAIEEKSSMIIESLSRCMCDMPFDEQKIAEQLRSAIEKIRETQGEDDLKDAEGFLYGAIQQLKESVERCREKEIERAKK